jgi:hypothetical protein
MLAAAASGCSGSHGGSQQPPPPPGDGGDGGDGGGEIDAPPGPPPSDAGPVVGTLRVDPVNRRYFTNGKAAVYLTGSHTWANFKDRAHADPPPAFDYAAYLQFLVDHRHNFTRLWTWEQTHSYDDDPNNLLYFSPQPWKRTGSALANDGKPKFDLDQLDKAYFDRLHDRVAMARDRGIYVSVMLFDGWDLASGYNTATGGYPLADGNNVNGVKATSTSALALSDAAVTARQDAYVRAVIDAVNDLDNVLFEIANESNRTADTLAWQQHMIQVVKDHEATKPNKHPVGMTSMYPGGLDSDLNASAADWISPVDRDAKSDGTKVVLNDTDHSYGWQQLKSDGEAAQRRWAWQTLCRGAQPLFMDPYLEVWAGRNTPPNATTPDPQWDNLRDALGFTQLYASKLDLERAVPSPSLCSTGFCLAEAGHQYLVYQPGSGSFTVTVTAGSYHFEWFDAGRRIASDKGMVTLPAGPHSFVPPFTGDAVLLLLQ